MEHNENTEALALEEQLHALACEAAGDPERLWLLDRLSRGGEAGRLWRETIEMQSLARAACGLGAAEAAMEAARRALLETGCTPGATTSPFAAAGNRAEGRLQTAPPRPPAVSGAAPGGRSSRNRLMRWGLRAAALLLVVASAFVATTAYLASRRVEEQFARLGQALTMPQASRAELASYSEIWRQVDQGAAGSAPWVVLADGVGQFGYLPVAEAGAAPPRLLLLRCRLVTGDGRPLESFNVIVPVTGKTRLSLPDVGRLHGRPVRCEVAQADQATTFAVMVGGDAGDAVGLQGRASVGGGPVDLGQFSMNGGRVHVVLQAVPLGGPVG